MNSNYRQASLPWFGSTALFLGVLLAILNAIELNGLPHFWYVNRTLWWAISFGLIAAGIAITSRLVQELPDDSPAWRPSIEGVRFRRVTLYTRENCSLCDKMLTLLRQHHAWLPDVELVDVDADPQLAARFGQHVPVVECDGKVRFRGRVPVALIRQLIEGTRPIG